MDVVVSLCIVAKDEACDGALGGESDAEGAR